MSDVRSRLEAEALSLRARAVHLDALVKRWLKLEAEALTALGEPESAAATPAEASPSPEEQKRLKARLYQREKRRRVRAQMAAARQAQQAAQEPPGAPIEPEPPSSPDEPPSASESPRAEHPLLRVPPIERVGAKADVFERSGSAPFLGRDWNGDATAEPAPC